MYVLKVFSIHAKCENCKMNQLVPARWLKGDDGYVYADVLIKTCSYCLKYPPKFSVDMREVMEHYREEWGPIKK